MARPRVEQRAAAPRSAKVGRPVAGASHPMTHRHPGSASRRGKRPAPSGQRPPSRQHPAAWEAPAATEGGGDRALCSQARPAPPVAAPDHCPGFIRFGPRPHLGPRNPRRAELQAAGRTGRLSFVQGLPAPRLRPPCSPAVSSAPQLAPVRRDPGPRGIQALHLGSAGRRESRPRSPAAGPVPGPGPGQVRVGHRRSARAGRSGRSPAGPASQGSRAGRAGGPGSRGLRPAAGMLARQAPIRGPRASAPAGEDPSAWSSPWSASPAARGW